jgi:hypothetical protein
MKVRAISMLLLGSAFLSISVAQTDAEAPPSQDFATVKADVLTRLQKETACVQAATSFDNLHACMPRPPGGGHRGPPPPER